MSRPEGDVCLLDKMSATVDMAKIDRKLTPIIAEILTLEPGNDQHPAIMELFNWLVDPQCTGEEYSYVIGELVDEVYFIMEKHFPYYMYDLGDRIYLCNVAAEAIAVKCPVLEGSWEQAAWTLVVLNEKTFTYVTASKLLSAWIIHVISDPDICPNPCLRYELMTLLKNIVDINDYNQTQAIDSVLSACSFLNIDYMVANPLDFHERHAIESVLSSDSSLNIDYLSTELSKLMQIQFNHITVIIESYIGYTFEFDDNLAKKLLDMKVTRCSTMIHDVGYHSTVTPNKFTEPRALYGIINLLNTTTESIQQIYKEIQIESCNMSFMVDKLHDTFDLIYVILIYFKASCQTPQLIDLTASCIMGIMEIVTQVKVDQLCNVYKNLFIYSLKKMNQLMKEFFYEHNVLHLTRMPLGLEISQKYKKRLYKIRGLLYHNNIFSGFSVIRAVLDDLCFSMAFQ